MKGFVLFSWLSKKTEEEVKVHKEFIQKNLKSLFSTTIQGKYGFSEFEAAYKLYMANLSRGKVLLRP